MSDKHLRTLQLGFVFLAIALLTWPSFLIYGATLSKILEFVNVIMAAGGWFLIATVCASAESGSMRVVGRICQVSITLNAVLNALSRFGAAAIAAHFNLFNDLTVALGIPNILISGAAMMLLMFYNLPRTVILLFGLSVLSAASFEPLFRLLRPSVHAYIAIAMYISIIGLIISMYSFGARVFGELKRRSLGSRAIGSTSDSAGRKRG